MPKFKQDHRMRVIVGLDLSKRSEPAFTRAVGLALEHNAELSILHVVNADLPETLESSHAQYATTVMQDHATRANNSGLSDVTQILARGRKYEKIADQAKQVDADLVVLGIHRSRGSAADLLGTTVDRVLRLSDCPVLLVRRQTSHRYKRILVAVDFSAASRRALETALALFPQAEVLAVNTWGWRLIPKDAALSEQPEQSEAHRLALSAFVREATEAAGPRSDGEARKIVELVEAGRPEVVIPELADERLTDLVVVGTHARTGLSHLLLGSVAQEIMLRVDTDVLAVPPLPAVQVSGTAVRDTLRVA